MKRTKGIAWIMVCLMLTGCASTSVATNFNGLKYVDGSVPVHINLTKYAIHFGVSLPMIGDATLDGAVEEFTKEAIKQGTGRVRIVQSDETILWWILPPLSFLFTPRWANVAGDGYK